MARNIKIFFFYMKYLMININELQIIKLLNELFIWKVCSHTPMLVNSTYWVISPPFISFYKYIRGVFGVEILGRQQFELYL